MLHSLHAIFKSGASECMAPPDASSSDQSMVLQQTHGYGLALVALAHLVADLPCGVPHRLLEELFDTATGLLLPPSAAGAWMDPEEVTPVARRMLQVNHKTRSLMSCWFFVFSPSVFLTSLTFSLFSFFCFV
jgi:hypothetical protein